MKAYLREHVEKEHRENSSKAQGIKPAKITGF